MESGILIRNVRNRSFAGANEVLLSSKTYEGQKQMLIDLIKEEEFPEKSLDDLLKHFVRLGNDKKIDLYLSILENTTSPTLQNKAINNILSIIKKSGQSEELKIDHNKMLKHTLRSVIKLQTGRTTRVSRGIFSTNIISSLKEEIEKIVNEDGADQGVKAFLCCLVMKNKDRAWDCHSKAIEFLDSYVKGDHELSEDVWSNIYYLLSENIEEDKKEKEEYLKKAAKGNHSKANYQLYSAEKDKEQKNQYLKDAAKCGHLKANYQLYLAEKDEEQKGTYLTKAAEYGYPKANYDLAMIILERKNPEQIKEAFEHLLKFISYEAKDSEWKEKLNQSKLLCAKLLFAGKYDIRQNLEQSYRLAHSLTGDINGLDGFKERLVENYRYESVKPQDSDVLFEGVEQNKLREWQVNKANFTNYGVNYLYRYMGNSSEESVREEFERTGIKVITFTKKGVGAMIAIKGRDKSISIKSIKECKEEECIWIEENARVGKKEKQKMKEKACKKIDSLHDSKRENKVCYMGFYTNQCLNVVSKDILERSLDVSELEKLISVFKFSLEDIYFKYCDEEGYNHTKFMELVKKSLSDEEFTKKEKGGGVIKDLDSLRGFIKGKCQDGKENLWSELTFYMKNKIGSENDKYCPLGFINNYHEKRLKDKELEATKLKDRKLEEGENYTHRHKSFSRIYSRLSGKDGDTPIAFLRREDPSADIVSNVLGSLMSLGKFLKRPVTPNAKSVSLIGDGGRYNTWSLFPFVVYDGESGFLGGYIRGPL